MIELSPLQEQKIQRSECRTWLELVARQWYASDFPDAENYPVPDLMAHLKALHTAWQGAGLENIEHLSLLAFDVLQANTLGFDPASVAEMVDFFIAHAEGDNVGYAQNWIDLQLETKA